MQPARAGEHRYDGIQALRCLAALLVVTTHSTFYASERLGSAVGVWVAGTRGVDVFFVISGFVMIIASRDLVDRPDGWRRFLFQRVTRVGPLYWMATSVKLLVMLAAGRYVLHAALDWPSVVKSYLFLPSRNVEGRVEPLLGVGWTLLYEMFFYALFAAALWFNRNVFIVMAPALVACALLSPLRPADFPPWMFYLDPIVLEFLFGMVVARACSRPWRPGAHLSWTVAAASFGTLMLADVGSAQGRWLSSGVPSALLIWSVASLEPHLRGRIPRPILVLGAASYALYLFHPLIAPLAPALLARVGLPDPLLSVALSILLATAVACLVHAFVEKPVLRSMRAAGRGGAGARSLASAQPGSASP